MSHVLTARERKALQELSFEHLSKRYLMKGEFGVDVGKVTLANLVHLGLIEEGPATRFPDAKGYRLTDDGFRAQYGVTWAEVEASGRTIMPLHVPRWPLPPGTRPRWGDPIQGR